VNFIPDVQLEGRASELWRQHRLEPGFDMELLLDSLGLSLLWEDLPLDVLGALKASDSLVILNQRHLPRFQATPGLERFTGGHEIGHWIFHAEEATTGVLPMLEGGRTWCRDGARTPTEIQADLFASFLLMPTDRLQPLLPASGWHGWPQVYDLAETFKVSATAMIVRLEKAGWAHRDSDGLPRSGRRPAMDSGQGLLPLN
jgi:IrrE N-terminal-like domain